MDGVIKGSLEYVVAGYLLTWITLGCYGLRLFLRYRSCRKESDL